MLLRGHRQRGELLIVVLDLQGGTVSDQGAVRQADTQGAADLGTFHGERVVILTVHVAGQNEIVFEDFQRLARDHVDRENAIACHFWLLKLNVSDAAPATSSPAAAVLLRSTHSSSSS